MNTKSDYQFTIIDKQVRRGPVILDLTALIRNFDFEEDYDGRLLCHWVEDAQINDEFESSTLKITRTQ